MKIDILLLSFVDIVIFTFIIIYFFTWTDKILNKVENPYEWEKRMKKIFCNKEDN